jgi:hypothetical protein
MKIMIPNRRKQPVFHQYSGQCFPQHAYLEFDPMLEGELTLTADYSGEMGNGVPEAVWHNRVLRVGIPSQVTLKALKDLRSDERLSNMLEQLRNSYDQMWRNGNWVGQFDTDLYYCVCEYTQERLYALMEGQA